MNTSYSSSQDDIRAIEDRLENQHVVLVCSHWKKIILGRLIISSSRGIIRRSCWFSETPIIE